MGNLLPSRIQLMVPEDLPEVICFWKEMEGIGLNESDSVPALSAYLQRNPKLSFVARNEQQQIVGAVLCGHDGRRGYLHHLAVARDYRKMGIGRALVEKCLSSLRALNILKCNIFLFSNNSGGEAFWREIGWRGREDLRLLQKVLLQ
ncbi:MAG TPA: GNAT family N-acetyltransferase [Thermodesulfobacteriota bacterium]|nr:GNAT family N-acetyltransferase [Thermodesulfobacteriota bacterium]